MKETKIEKLILDLSNRWDCSPQEAVDRLNSMNESEINKLINSMTKKFQSGGLAGLQEVKLPNNEYYSIGTRNNEVYEKASAPGKVLYRRVRTRFPKNGGTPVLDTLITRGTVNGEQITNTLNMTSPYKKTGSLVDKEVWKQLNDAMDSRKRAALSFKNGGFIDCLRNGGSISKCKCGCDKIAKAQEGEKVLPQFGKIVEQGWNAPRYTFLSDVNGGDLSTVTPGNIGTYDGMSYAVEQVANPWGQYVNQMNKIAGLPEMSRMYRQPEFKTMIQQDDRGVPVSVEYSMDFLNPQFDQKKATKELSEKQADIRAQKKACGGPLPKKSKFKK